MVGKIINLNRSLTVIAILGFLSGIYMLILDRRPAPVSHPVTPPSISPYTSFISGAGLVEAASENISVGTMVGGTADKILVKKGDIVSKDQPLFTLDSRQAAADLQVKIEMLKVAKAALEQAKASLTYAQHELDLVSNVKDKRGLTKEEIINRQDNVVIAQKAVENAQASVNSAQAQVNESQVVLDYYTIKAPIDCQVLQINIHPGEYAAPTSVDSSNQTANLPAPLMLVGSINRYHVRVDVDENDAWRFNHTKPAVIYLRGNIQFHTDLKFEYIEPYVIPKQSLTGDSTERVDTRVLQVVYSFDPKKMPVYLGQETDVYIQADPVSPQAQYGGPLPVSR